MKRLIVISSLSCCLGAVVAKADESRAPLTQQTAPKEAVLSAEAILKKSFTKGFLGMAQGTATIRMQIMNSEGAVKDRLLSIKTRTGEDQLVAYLIKFDKPVDIKGTAFLMREKKGELPEQFIYVPAAKVVRRVAAGNAAGSFFGSDFLYADLMPFPEDKKGEAAIRSLPESKVAGRPVYVVQVEPKQKESPYSKILIHIDKENYVGLQIDFYDPSGKLLKVLRVKKLQKVGTRMVPVEIEMKNEQVGSKTTISISNINADAKLKAADFTETAMQK